LLPPADADDHLRSAVPFAENLLKDIACHSPDFDIASFVPQLASRMDSIKPYNRRFILGWIEALAGSTMIDILVFLPDLLDGLMAMLSDRMSVLVLRKTEERRGAAASGGAAAPKPGSAGSPGVFVQGPTTAAKPAGGGEDWQPQEIRHMAADVLEQILRYIEEQGGGDVDFGALVEHVLVRRAEDPEQHICLTALRWLHVLIKLSCPEVPLLECSDDASTTRLQLLPHFDGILHALFKCVSRPDEAIKGVTGAIIDDVLKLKDSESWQQISVNKVLELIGEGLSAQEEATRLLALRYINFLLHIRQKEVLHQANTLLPALLGVMIYPSDRVVLESLTVQAAFAASSDSHFKQYIAKLVASFQAPQGAELLQRRGSMVLRRLCMLLGPDKCFLELAARLTDQTNLKYASTMVQALNLILLTAPETKELRHMLQRSQDTPAGRQLFLALYKSWAHSPGALLTLCFLAQEYTHAAALINTFGEMDWDIQVLVQLDRVVRLLEAPVFTFLRLHILKPAEHPTLLHALYGLLMLLPQGEAFKTLSTRLKAVPMMAMVQLGETCPQNDRGKQKNDDKGHGKDGKNERGADAGVDFEALLMHFKGLQCHHTAEIELRRTASLKTEEPAGFSPSNTPFPPLHPSDHAREHAHSVGNHMSRVVSEPAHMMQDRGW